MFASFIEPQEYFDGGLVLLELVLSVKDGRLPSLFCLEVYALLPPELRKLFTSGGYFCRKLDPVRRMASPGEVGTTGGIGALISLLATT